MSATHPSLQRSCFRAVCVATLEASKRHGSVLMRRDVSLPTLCFTHNESRHLTHEHPPTRRCGVNANHETSVHNGTAGSHRIHAGCGNSSTQRTAHTSRHRPVAVASLRGGRNTVELGQQSMRTHPQPGDDGTFHQCKAPATHDAFLVNTHQATQREKARGEDATNKFKPPWTIHCALRTTCCPWPPFATRLTGAARERATRAGAAAKSCPPPKR